MEEGIAEVTIKDQGYVPGQDWVRPAITIIRREGHEFGPLGAARCIDHPWRHKQIVVTYRVG
jgi:hypothetical protein